MGLINLIKHFKMKNTFQLFFLVTLLSISTFSFGQITLDPVTDEFIVTGEELTFTGTFDDDNYNLNTIQFFSTDDNFNIPSGASPISIPDELRVFSVTGNALGDDAWGFTIEDSEFFDDLNNGYFRVFISVVEIGNNTALPINVAANITIDRLGPQPKPNTLADTVFNTVTPVIRGTYSDDSANGEESDSVVVKIIDESNNVQVVLQTHTDVLSLSDNNSANETWTLDFDKLSTNYNFDLDFGKRYKIAFVTYDTSHISHPATGLGYNVGDKTNISADTALLIIGMEPTLTSPQPSSSIIDPTPLISGEVTVHNDEFVLDSMVVEITSREAGSSFVFSYPSPDQGLFAFFDTDSFTLDLSDTVILELALDTFDVDITTYDVSDIAKVNAEQYFIIEFPDTDGDGISDFIECGDTIVDTDTDEGKAVCAAINTDEDDEPDYLDLDSDNDSIPDAVEVFPTLSSFKAGVLIADSLSHLLDSDGDGTPNYLDEDSDGDQISDYFESGQFYNSAINAFGDTTFLDTDRDDTLNYLELDADNDLLSDQLEAISFIDPEDIDEDGIQNFLDIDSDGDYIPDSTETGNDGAILGDDFDLDNIPNFRDVDSDNDGINDSTELKPTMNTVLTFPVYGTDILNSDGTGLANYLDTDSDDDAILDTFELADDPDNDNIPSYLDDDSDGDGLLDEDEFDGDFGSGALFTLVDSEPNDFDSDDLYDFKDTDSDGDSILDSTEIKGNNTTYTSTSPPDNFGGNDSDDFPNHLDLDADGDFIPDSVELAVDSDLDTDGDLNYLDLDSDGDGLLDSLESGLFYISSSVGFEIDVFQDADDDGILNSLQTDADSDGYADALEYDFSEDGDASLTRGDVTIVNEPDENDGDGIFDFLDNTFNTVYTSPTGIDTETSISSEDGDWDSDGHLDEDEFVGYSADSTKPVDTDGDGYYDFADLDTDDDGFSDNIEECDNPTFNDCDIIQEAEADTPEDDNTAITPDGDGLVVNPTLNATLKVFNRWGQIVYEQSPYPSITLLEVEFWKGTTQDGDLLPVGTYFYTLEYEGKLESSYVYIIR